MAQENDIVLIYCENKPLAFARIEEIFPDIKKDWFNVKLLFLQLPLQTVIWTLKDVYINGENFTMNSKKMKLELVVSPEDKTEPNITDNNQKKNKSLKSSKTISLADYKKNKNHNK